MTARDARGEAVERLAAVLESMAYIHDPFTSSNGNCGADDSEIDDQIVKPYQRGDEKWRTRAETLLTAIGAVIPDPDLVARVREAEAALAAHVEATNRPGLPSRERDEYWRAKLDLADAVLAQLQKAAKPPEP